MIDWNDNAKATLQAFEDYLRENGVVGFDNGFYLQSFYSEFNPDYSNPAQTKTVADAVEYYEGVWPKGKDEVCIWDDELKAFEFWFSNYAPVSYCYEVCTRAEFEAYVKEQESSQQSCSEGEKWTHTYNDLKCRALIDEPDREGYIVIVNELNEYYCVDDEELKPIKPTLTKAEAWDKLQYMAGIEGYTYSNAVEEIYDRYEVTND